MPADVNFGSQKIIDAKPVKSRKRKKLTLYAALLAVFLWLGLILAVADKFYYHNYFKIPQPAPAANASYPPTPLPVVDKEVKSEAAELQPEKQKTAKGDDVEIRLGKLEAANKNLLAYFAARDLKDSLGDNENFKTQLEFLKNLAAADANMSAKVDILEQAAADGLVTREKLLSDLKALEKNMANASDGSFSGSIKSAFGNLVKVSKIEGEVNAADYNSLLKRAEITLKQEKISAAEMQDMINNITKLGHPAENFVREASSLQRVLEVTDFLVTYTKAKAIQAND